MKKFAIHSYIPIEYTNVMDVWDGKTKMVWLPEGEKTLICVAISTKYRRVTDGQTSCHGIDRATHMRRVVKITTNM